MAIVIISFTINTGYSQTEKAKIYVINPKTKPYVYELFYYLDGKFIGGVFKKGNVYFELDVEPGEHYITTQIVVRNQMSKIAIFKSYNSIKVDAKAGEKYYIKKELLARSVICENEEPHILTFSTKSAGAMMCSFNDTADLKYKKLN
jgi:hypothetical protein